MKNGLLESFLKRGSPGTSRPFIPNMGGIFKSTVKQVKRAMKTVINDQLLPEKTLHTVLVEAEAIINRRPLTGVSNDINDNETHTKPLPHRTV